MASPRSHLCVGVTGHRPNRMPAEQVPRILADLSRVMERIAAANPGRRLVLASGLAEGADRYAAFVALGLGWRLRAILAFHRSRFEGDFPAKHAIGEFRALLAVAMSIEEPRRGWERGRPPEDGYHAVGERLLAVSEILVGVWDGEGSRGRGGTVDVIDAARARGVPVIWVHAAQAVAPKLLKPRAQRKRGIAVTAMGQGRVGR